MCLALGVVGHGPQGHLRGVKPTSQLALLGGQGTPDMLSAKGETRYRSAYITVVYQNQSIVWMFSREEGDAHCCNRSAGTRRRM